MADSFVVAARYQFSANFEVLARVAEQTARIAEVMKGAQGAARALGSSFSAFGKTAVAATDRASTGLSEMQRRMRATTASIDGATVAMRRFHEVRDGGGAGGAGSRFLDGAGTFAGVTSAVTLVAGVKQAADVQAAINRISVQTGRLPADVSKNFMPMAYAASNRTGMSAMDALAIVAQTAGIIKDPRELNATLMGSKSYAGIFDTVAAMKRQGVEGDPAAISRNLVIADHMLNAYRGPEMGRVNDSLYRATVGSHLELGPFVTQLGYFAEQMRLAMGSRPAATDEILRLGEASFFGVGRQKWGAGLNQMLRTIEKPTKAQIPYLEQLGLINSRGRPSSVVENARGEYTPVSMIEQAGRVVQNMKPLAGQELLQRAFTVNGARVIAEISSPKTRAFIQRLEDAQSKMDPVTVSQQKSMENLRAQTDRLTRGFSNLAGVVAGPTLGPLTNVVSSAANAMNGSIGYLTSHPVARNVAAGAAIAGSALVAGRAAEFLGFGKFLEPFSKMLGGAGKGVLTGIGDALPQIGRVGTALRDVAGVFGAFGREVVFTRGGLALLGETFGRLGLRAIPVVGNLLLVWDAIKAFVTHGTDLSAIAGKAEAWMDVVGKPKLVNAITGAWSAAVSALLKAIPASIEFIGATVKNYFSGGHDGGLQGAEWRFAQDLHKRRNDNEWAEKNRYRAEVARLRASGAGAGGGGTTINHFHGDINLPNVKNPADFGRAFADYRHQNARVGGAPTSPFAPPALSMGIGSGR